MINTFSINFNGGIDNMKKDLKIFLIRKKT